jgi:hypothetical protein
MSIRFLSYSDCTSNVLLHSRAHVSHGAPICVKGNTQKISILGEKQKKTAFQDTMYYFSNFLYELSLLFIIILTAQIMNLQKRRQLSPFILKKYRVDGKFGNSNLMFLRLRNYVFPPGCGYHDNCLQHVEQIRLGFLFLINYVNYSFMQKPGMLRKFSLARNVCFWPEMRCSVQSMCQCVQGPCQN